MDSAWGTDSDLELSMRGENPVPVFMSMGLVLAMQNKQQDFYLQKESLVSEL